MKADVRERSGPPAPVPVRVMQYAGLVVVGLIMVVPLYWLIISSVKPSAEINRLPIVWFPTDLRLSNYPDAWNAAPFADFLVNSLVTTGIGTALEMACAILTAYAFAYLRFPFKGALFMVLLGALMVPGHVTLLPNYLTISSLGWTNTYAGLIVPTAASAFGTFLLRQHMLTISQDVLDAAKIDGAGHLRILWRVVLPMSRPILVTTCLISVVGKWNEFIWPLIATNTSSMRTLPVGLLFLKNEQGYNNWGIIMAGTVFVLLPMLILFLVAQRYIVAGLTHGATKG